MKRLNANACFALRCMPVKSHAKSCQLFSINSSCCGCVVSFAPLRIWENQAGDNCCCRSIARWCSIPKRKRETRNKKRPELDKNTLVISAHTEAPFCGWLLAELLWNSIRTLLWSLPKDGSFCGWVAVARIETVRENKKYWVRQAHPQMFANAGSTAAIAESPTESDSLWMRSMAVLALPGCPQSWSRESWRLQLCH